MTTKPETTSSTAKAAKADGTRVKQGLENAVAEEKKDTSKPPYTTAQEDRGDEVPVTLADGTPATVNAEAQNSTQMLNEQARRQLEPADPRVATAAEQARQNDVLSEEDFGKVDKK